ncbi:sensor histidine kinase [Fibrella aestuarina]|uniref:Sensor histidine kinase n=1 Tax=Fibrivirga algicola TaxID=2950420 RepID=A0ABX0QN28_9BACT|nr:sensor histidine kinase [Fibrivirga algicola]
MVSFLHKDAQRVIAFRRPITWKRVLWHVIFWGLSCVLTLSQFRRAFADQPNDELLYVVNAHHFLTTLLSFGLLGYVLIPQILYKPRSLVQHLLLTAGALGGYYGLMCLNTYSLLRLAQAHYAPLPKYLARRVDLFMQARWYDYLIDPSILFFVFGLFISYILIPLLIKAIRDGYARNQAQLAIEKERQQLELNNVLLEKENATKDLQFLRQQINPHFLLNAFNNIYALIHRRDSRAAETLANLSTLMRYTLYRTSQEFVPLHDELLFLQGYIDMERIRHSQPEAVECSLPEPTEPMRQWLIPPLLLVTFVENAFKHGLNAVYEGGWVQISLITELADTGILAFTVANNKSETSVSPTIDGGIGLTNVKRRLALLYPEQNYELVLQDQSERYYVRLTIPLKRKSETIATHEYVPTLFTN